MYYTSEPRYTGGNAVTLTLLGLAVAILAGVGVLYVVGKNTPQPIAFPETREVTTTQEALPSLIEENTREGWRTYNDETYDFTLEYPRGWSVSTGEVFGVPVVTVYDASQQVSTTSSFGVHELPLRVSAYPQGLPTGGAGEQKVQSRTIIAVPQASAMDYVLGTGRPWATVAQFEQYPDSWTDAGFLYGRVDIFEEEIAYMRGDVGISPEEFDAYAGDEQVTYGFVDIDTWEVVSDILRSFSFTSIEASDMTDVAFIEVTAPLPYATVTSPLLVEGRAHGSWYFEGSFPIRVTATDGTVLAEVSATALDDWMQDAPVPFEVSVVFDIGTATSGLVILSRDNPSGLPEHDVTEEVPVVFAD